MTNELRKQLEADLRVAADRTSMALEGVLEIHHLAMRIEFDGSNRKERVFSACLPGMKLAGAEPGRSPLILARFGTLGTAIAALAKALEGKTLQSDDGTKRVSFPFKLDVESLVVNLEPDTEVERLALDYVTDVAIRMVVPFSLTREAYDNLWRATMGASMLQTDLRRQLLVPISVVNEHPFLAIKDIAWQLGGRMLYRRGMEFHAPALPNARYTLQEEIHAGKRSGREWAFDVSVQRGAFG
jgi:hypothetical protein